jgi:hypothetical protein
LAKGMSAEEVAALTGLASDTAPTSKKARPTRRKP